MAKKTKVAFGRNLVEDYLKQAERNIQQNLVPELDEQGRATGGYYDQRIGTATPQPDPNRLKAHLIYLQQKYRNYQPEAGKEIPEFNQYDPYESGNIFESIVNMLKSGYAGSLTAMAEKGLGNIGIGDKTPDAFGLINQKKLEQWQPNKAEQIGSNLTSFVMPLDLATLFLGGAAGTGIAKGAGISSKLATGAIKGATQLGIYEGAKGLPEGKPLESGLKGAVLGGTFGVVGEAVPMMMKGSKAIATRAARTGAEFVTLGTVSPFIEGRMPTTEDYVNAAGFIVGIKAAGVAGKLGGKLLGRKVLSEIKNLKEETERTGNAKQAFTNRVNANIKSNPEFDSELIEKAKLANEGEVVGRVNDFVIGEKTREFFNNQAPKLLETEIIASKKQPTNIPGGEKATGWIKDGKIYINPETPEHIGTTILHEAQHLLRKAKGRSLEEGRVEETAEGFAETASEGQLKLGRRAVVKAERISQLKKKATTKKGVPEIETVREGVAEADISKYKDGTTLIQSIKGMNESNTAKLLKDIQDKSKKGVYLSPELTRTQLFKSLKESGQVEKKGKYWKLKEITYDKESQGRLPSDIGERQEFRRPVSDKGTGEEAAKTGGILQTQEAVTPSKIDVNAEAMKRGSEKKVLPQRVSGTKPVLKTRIDVPEKGTPPVQNVGKGKEVPTKEPPEPPVVEQPAGKLPEGEEGIVGLSNAETERIRTELKLEERDPVKRKAVETSFAQAKEANYDVKANEIAKDVISSKRLLTDAEYCGLNLRARQLHDAINTETAEYIKLADKGDIPAANTSRTKIELLRKEYEDIIDASEVGGTEIARSLSIRRYGLTEDFSPASIVNQARVAKGSKLTPEETAKFEKMANDYAVLEKRLNELTAKHEQELIAKEKEIAEKYIIREGQKAVIREKTKITKEKIYTERAEIKKQIAALGYRVNDITGVTAEGAYWIGRLAINYIKEGVVNLDEVVKLVRADIPGLTDRDVYRSLIAKRPDYQQRAKTDVTKQIQQLKTQSRLLLEIDKAEKGIFEQPKNKPETPENIRGLQKKLKELRSELYKSKNENLKIDNAIQRINELQDQLTNRYRNIRKNKPVPSEQLVDIQDKIKQLKKSIRVEDELADLNEQLRTGDFKVKIKKSITGVPPELERAQIDLRVARRRVNNSIYSMEPWTGRKVVAETVNTARTLKATADFSAILRQGLVFTARHPLRAANIQMKAIPAFFRNFKAEQIDNAIKSSPNYYLYEKAKLPLSELSGKPTAKEEYFAANLVERIPVLGSIIRASNRHMTTTLNLMRKSAFDEFLEAFPNATNQEMSAAANWIGIMTGRGDLGKLAVVGNELSLGLFAPKFAASRIQTPFMIFKYWKQPRVRKLIAKDLAATIGFGTTALGLASLAGYAVGTDPRSADWGKIRVGNTRIDIWGGFQQPARLVARLGVWATDKSGLTGKDLTEREKSFDPVEMFGRFAAFKLSPLVTIPRELITGKTAVGETVTLPETAARSIMPMVYEDIYEAYKQKGWSRAVLVGGLNFIGVGTNTYEVQNKIDKLQKSIQVQQKILNGNGSFKTKSEAVQRLDKLRKQLNELKQ